MKKLLVILNVVLIIVLAASLVFISRTDVFKRVLGHTETVTEITLVGFDTTTFVDREYVPPKPIDYYAENGIFELPINGASGYASVRLNVYDDASWGANYLDTLDAGQGFTILRESDSWWEIEYSGIRGWVEHTSLMINLPDVIPSIVYNNTNVTASVFRSSGIAIPNVTGLALYSAYGYNARFGENQYVMPVLYSTAKKICQAQHAALADGNTLIIYEAFRPYSAQQLVYTNLSALISSNATVAAGVTASPWSISWFILQGTSNHQVGYAMDVSLGRVVQQEHPVVEGYVFTKTTVWEEYTMPTPIHELSAKSVVFTQPITPNTSAWQSATLASTMNNPAVLLQRYNTGAGFTPLASEWWHFNDSDTRAVVEPMGGTGSYIVSEAYSVPPQNLLLHPFDTNW